MHRVTPDSLQRFVVYCSELPPCLAWRRSSLADGGNFGLSPISFAMRQASPDLPERNRSLRAFRATRWRRFLPHSDKRCPSCACLIGFGFPFSILWAFATEVVLFRRRKEYGETSFTVGPVEKRSSMPSSGTPPLHSRPNTSIIGFRPPPNRRSSTLNG